MQPLLYDIIDRHHLHKMLETFYQCINLPIQILNEKGEILDSFGQTHAYCRIFKNFFLKMDPV